MSNISPNTLFHFAQKMEYLINIFERGFQPRYCKEEVIYKTTEDGEKSGFSFGVPMTCFCDISLSQISNHVSKYGNYGIGMTKEWAIKNKLNPIIYLNPNSKLSAELSMIQRISNLENISSSGENIKPLLDNALVNLMSYHKPYSNGDIRFYDEREWRYVPSVEGRGDNHIFVNIIDDIDMDNLETLEVENKKLFEYRLDFTPDDVKYIVVQNDDEIIRLINKLREIKSVNYSKNQIDLLISKIITTKKIKEDF